MKNIDAAEHQVQRADVLVIGGRDPAMPEADRLVVVLVVLSVGRGRVIYIGH